METAGGRIARIARGQYGLCTTQQLLDAQLTLDQIRRRVERGDLDRLGYGVYRVPGTPTDRRGDLLAVLLGIDVDARATGPTGAALHGYDGYVLRPPFDMVVPHRTSVVRPGHRIHSTDHLAPIDRATLLGIPVTSAARTLIDLARTETPERLTVALDSGLRDGKFSESFLHRRIVTLRGSGRSGVRTLLDVIDGAEVTRGGHSWLEREYLRLIAQAGLPRPETQAVLSRTRNRLVRVDARFPGTRVVGEVLGYRFHRTREQMRRDAERLNALVLDGFVPVQHTYDQVVDEPHEVVADLRRALLLASAA